MNWLHFGSSLSSSYLIAEVKNRKVQRYLSDYMRLDSVPDDGKIICYQIDPKIQTSLRNISLKDDANYGLASNYTPLVINLAVY